MMISGGKTIEDEVKKKKKPKKKEGGEMNGDYAAEINAENRKNENGDEIKILLKE